MANAVRANEISSAATKSNDGAIAGPLREPRNLEPAAFCFVAAGPIGWEAAANPPAAAEVAEAAEGGAVPATGDILAVRFESEEAFRHEYSRNIVKGGIFIPTVEPFELHQRVEVCIELCYAQASSRLAGRVVSHIPRELAAAGALPGVAVQLDASINQLHAEFDPYLSMTVHGETENETTTGSGRRQARRSPARIPVRLRSPNDKEWKGRTRNLSRGGALLSIAEDPANVGEKVWLCIANPASGEEREIPSKVVRHVVGENGSIVALAVEFQPEPTEAAELERFLEGVGAAEHNRRLAGISGSINPFGLANLLQSFGEALPAGTMTLMRGAEEGIFAFEDGLLVAAHLGRATGRKALTRVLTWDDGSFDFQAQVDPGIVRGTPRMLQAVLLDSIRIVDESRRPGAPQFAPETTVHTGSPASALTSEESGKLEASIADLAAVGIRVQELMELIPEPDFEIAQALARLAEQGVVVLSD